MECTHWFSAWRPEAHPAWPLRGGWRWHSARVGWLGGSADGWTMMDCLRWHLDAMMTWGSPLIWGKNMRKWMICTNTMHLEWKTWKYVQLRPMNKSVEARCHARKNSWVHAVRITETEESPHGCFLKWWYPQIIHFNRVFHHFHHPFWDTPIFRKHPHVPCLNDQNACFDVASGY